METATIQIPEETQAELTLLRGFRDLIAEKTGYFLGAKALGKTMSDETADERKAVTTASKNIRQAIATLIEQPTKKHSQEVIDEQALLKVAQEKNNTARKPHMEKISPLRKIVRYIDVVAVPDSLKELGCPVQPRFSLSEWAKKAIA